MRASHSARTGRAASGSPMAKTQGGPQQETEDAEPRRHEKEHRQFTQQKPPEGERNGQEVFQGIVGIFPAGHTAADQDDHGGKK